LWVGVATISVFSKSRTPSSRRLASVAGGQRLRWAEERSLTSGPANNPMKLPVAFGAPAAYRPFVACGASSLLVSHCSMQALRTSPFRQLAVFFL
jgi:hypothetical protein